MPEDYFSGLNSAIAAAVTQNPKGDIVIRVNPRFASDVVNRAQPYKAFPYKAKPALEKVADYVRTEMIPRTFAAEGPGWRRLSRRTQRERVAQGYGAHHPILVRTKDLYKELVDKSHPNHVEMVKTGKYARVEVGGSSEKFVRNQLGDFARRIPSRPMIPGTEWLRLPDRDRMMIKKILEDGIRKELARG